MKRKRASSLPAIPMPPPLPAGAVAYAPSSTMMLVGVKADSSTSTADLPTTGFADLPTELHEAIYSWLDGTALCQARLVCRKWAHTIDSAPQGSLPKVHYRSLTVTAQRGLEIIMEKFADEAVLDIDELPTPPVAASPPSKRRKGEEDKEAKGTVDITTATYDVVANACDQNGQRVMKKQKRATLTRTRIGAMLKCTDRLTHSEMPHLMKYFRHIDADRLVLQVC